MSLQVQSSLQNPTYLTPSRCSLRLTDYHRVATDDFFVSFMLLSFSEGTGMSLLCQVLRKQAGLPTGLWRFPGDATKEGRFVKQ